ncbi:hypothetical protein P6B95_04720 [Streptomyces atratus]|uniref:hypothetical protein n=1 Tax=Streptomyces atratus TaxID=1893 RepID=UPI001670B299|nr:hypothetical protein [Streptomyces atratus]WPW26788.1 hypothetical protein P6B95_04720 [Streptomyces atratus]GGT44557.1 hypothetical protein GCM10010207_51100 [Streptomyces atratus]
MTGGLWRTVDPAEAARRHSGAGRSEPGFASRPGAAPNRRGVPGVHHGRRWGGGSAMRGEPSGYDEKAAELSRPVPVDVMSHALCAQFTLT